MTDGPSIQQSYPPIPPDDPDRNLTLARPGEDQDMPHIGMVGDTYTILLSGEDTAGRYTLIDMHVPPGGGPAPHRHDFEEMFTILDGEIEATFRGETSTVRAGETVNIPANAPHSFTNASEKAARLLCICAPLGVGLKTWPDTRLMRLKDPVSEQLARRGGLSLRLVNLLRELTLWRLAVELEDGQGRRLKAKFHEVPPWEG